MTDPTKDAPLPPELEDLAQREGHTPASPTMQQRRDTEAFEAKLAEYGERFQAMSTIARIRPASRSVQRLAAGLVLQQIQHVRIDLDDLVERLATGKDEDLVAAFIARREIATQLHAMTNTLSDFAGLGTDIAKSINLLDTAENSAGGA